MTYGLSVTTLLLLVAALYRRLSGHDLVTVAEKRIVYLTTLGVGVVFYPLALGLGPFDPYALGFVGGRLTLLLVLLLIGALLALVRRHGFILAALLTAVATFSLGLGASQNLWDYLLDPWLVLAAAVRIGPALRSFDRIPNSGKSEPVSPDRSRS